MREFVREGGRLFLASLLLFCVIQGGWGQSGTAAPRHDNLVFKMAVYGPSDEIFIWWGHAALIVENTTYNYARVYDWGIFTYPGDSFLWDFLRNQVRYKCTVSSGGGMEDYIAEDRDVTLYTLDLDDEGKDAILKYAENSVLPDNCFYQYHEFRENCSTGIRRLIDLGTGGQFREHFENSPGRFTLRDHARRFTWANPAADWFLGFLMGQTLDRPVSVWEEMFLPVELARNMTGFRYTDHTGLERKLVTSAEIINGSKNRPPVLHAPRALWPEALAAGLIAAVFLGAVELFRKRFPRPGRILWGILQCVLGLLLGAAGTVLFYGEFFLPEDYIRQNFNLLFINPLFFLLVPLGICAALGRPRRLLPERYIRAAWVYVFAAVLFTMLIKLLPPFHQQNLPVQLLILPPAAVLALSPFTLARTGVLTPVF